MPSLQVNQITRNIKVVQNTNNIKVRQVNKVIQVNTVGRRGPAGTNGIVSHGSVADTARPDITTPVIWIGSVEPENIEVYDLWISTA